MGCLDLLLTKLQRITVATNSVPEGGVGDRCLRDSACIINLESVIYNQLKSIVAGVVGVEECVPCFVCRSLPTL